MSSSNSPYYPYRACILLSREPYIFGIGEVEDCHAIMFFNEDNTVSAAGREIEEWSHGVLIPGVTYNYDTWYSVKIVFYYTTLSKPDPSSSYTYYIYEEPSHIPLVENYRVIHNPCLTIDGASAFYLSLYAGAGDGERILFDDIEIHYGGY